VSDAVVWRERESRDEDPEWTFPIKKWIITELFIAGLWSFAQCKFANYERVHSLKFIVEVGGWLGVVRLGQLALLANLIRQNCSWRTCIGRNIMVSLIAWRSTLNELNVERENEGQKKGVQNVAAKEQK